MGSRLCYPGGGGGGGGSLVPGGGTLIDGARAGAGEVVITYTVNPVVPRTNRHDDPDQHATTTTTTAPAVAVSAEPRFTG
jgi:hypothetical protein